jgi:NIPSNAP
VELAEDVLRGTLRFERFGRRWIELVDSHGGMHHGYFLPAEGASDKALTLFSFPSLAAYEQYRALFGSDPDFIEAEPPRSASSSAAVGKVRIRRCRPTLGW